MPMLVSLTLRGTIKQQRKQQMQRQSNELTTAQFAIRLLRDTGVLREDQGLTPVQLQICRYLDGGDKRKIACAFRGVGKSTLAACYSTKRLYDDPNRKLLIISASEGRAEAMTAWMLKTITDLPWLQHMKPNTSSGRYSKMAFDIGTCAFIEQSPSVRPAGIKGQITGSRATDILIDDPETPTTALTQVQRMRLRDQLNEVEAIIKPGDDSRITYLGTPHSSTDSIYFYLAKEMGYKMRMWPARVPETEVPYRNMLAPVIEELIAKIPGKPTDTRFTEIELCEREGSMSRPQWRLQYMLDPTLTDKDKYPLRCSDLMVMDIGENLPEIVTYSKSDRQAIRKLSCPGMLHDPWWYEPAAFSGSIASREVPTILAIDPSAGGSDELAWAIVKAYAGNYFLVESGGRKGGLSEELGMELALLAKKHYVNGAIIESNFGGLEVWAQALKPFFSRIGHPVTFEPFRSNTKKEVRIIDTLAPVVQTHKVIIDRRVIEKDNEIAENALEENDVCYSLFYQYTRINYERGCLIHDDRLDVFAMAVQWFQEQAAQRQDQISETRRLELLEAEIGDENGYMLMNIDRLALGMTLEQARKAEASTGISRGSWLSQ